MVLIDWTQHRAHRQAVARDVGQWVGLVDQDGVPLLEAPPLVDLSAPRIRNAAGEVRASFAVRSPLGHVHPVVDDLIADGLGRVDTQGQLEVVADATRFLVVERPRSVRSAYRVTHVVARGQGSAPSELIVHGVGLLKLLSMIPAMSAPTTWTGTWETFTRDWAGPEDEPIIFEKPRDLAGMQMVAVADGATIEGPAESAIRRLISESLEAAFRVAGVADDPPIVVAPHGSGVPSPHVLIRPMDGPLLEEVAPVALAAGVHLDAQLWWPGDSPVLGLALSKPTVVVTVRQSVEVES